MDAGTTEHPWRTKPCSDATARAGRSQREQRLHVTRPQDTRPRAAGSSEALPILGTPVPSVGGGSGLSGEAAEERLRQLSVLRGGRCAGCGFPLCWKRCCDPCSSPRSCKTPASPAGRVTLVPLHQSCLCKSTIGVALEQAQPVRQGPAAVDRKSV